MGFRRWVRTIGRSSEEQPCQMMQFHVSPLPRRSAASFLCSTWHRTWRVTPTALERLGRELRYAFEQVGFYYLRGHGVPQPLIDATFEQAERFHALPLERKLALRINEHNIGYMPMGGSVARSSTVHRNRKPSVNEAFFLRRERTPDDPDVIANKRFRGLNRWPDDLPGFRDTVLAYMTAMEALGRRLVPIYAVALGLPADYFDAMFARPNMIQRLTHYPPQAELRRRRVQHRPAHQFRLHDTARAVQGAGTVDPAAGRDVVRCAVDRGRVRRQRRRHPAAPDERPVPRHPHRAINSSGQHRYAIPFFFDPHPDTLIECVPTCASADNPPRYEPVTYDQYALWYTTQNYVHLAQAVEAAPAPAG